MFPALWRRGIANDAFDSAGVVRAAAAVTDSEVFLAFGESSMARSYPRLDVG